MSNSDLQMYHVSFDGEALMNDIIMIIDSQFDILSKHMIEVIGDAIIDCSAASGIMKNEARKNVKEISRTITASDASIEVGVDEGAIGGGEREYIRVMVTLHGNGEVWARANGTGWTKHVNSRHQNHVSFDYRLAQFEQSDNSAAMLETYEQNIQVYSKECYDSIISLINGLDYEKYLRIG